MENTLLIKMHEELVKVSKALVETNDEERRHELREVYLRLRHEYVKQKQWVDALENRGTNG